MKRILSILLVIVLLLAPSASFATSFQMPSIVLPEDSTVFSATFATQAISLCQTNPQLLALMGLTIAAQAHYDKAPEDVSHTSAYTMYQGTVTHKEESRPLMVVVIRATEAGEWYSNFDFASSQDNETQYAENFYAATKDIYDNIKPVLAQVEKPLIVATGYSRGAACANLLGMMLNQDYPVEDVYVYTAATPNTVRGEAAKIECPNVFNVINPCDLITYLPLNSWGYSRLGQDIVLPGDPATQTQLTDVIAKLTEMVPDIASYYTKRLSLTGAGESEVGLTTYEMMLRLADKLTGKLDAIGTAVLQMLPAESDFAPLLKLFLASADDPASVMNQHMPTAYAQQFVLWQLMQ